MRRALRAGTLAVVAGAAMISVGTRASALQEAGDRYWPQWRGPRFSGVAPHADPPITWSETENVAWKVEVPGSGFATPIVWGDKVFLLTAVPVAADGGGQAAPAESMVETGGALGPFLPAVGVGSAAPRAGVDVGGTTGSKQQRRGRRRRGAAAPLAAMDFTVVALNRADGSPAWSRVATRETPHEGKQTNNSWASGSAVTDGEHVFAFFGSRGLYAYDIDGTPLWERDFGEMRIRGGFGEGSTPVLHGDRLVVVWDHQGDSFIAVLDKRTGEEAWRVPRDEPESWATPLVVEVGGRAQVITGAENRTRSYDLETGEIVWEGPGLTVNPIPSPVTANGVVYLMSGYRGNALLAVRLAEARGDIGGTAAVLWEYNRDTPYVPSPLLYEGSLFFLKSNSPILTAFDVESGRVRYGPQRLDGVEEVYASPVGAAGRVYILGRDGGALVIDSGGEFNVLATNSLDDGFEASPAIVGDEIYLRGRRFLYRIEELGRPGS